jgi:hypothetical protein
MGLKTDILEAKKQSLLTQGIEIRDEDFAEGSPNEIEARYMTDAIVDFLTHDDLHFTVSKLKASVELEEFNVSEDIDADVKSEKVVKDKVSEISAVKTGVDFLVGYVEKIIIKEVPVVKMTIGEILPPLGQLISIYKSFWKTTEKAVVKSIPESEGKRDINIPAFDFRKDGGKQGGELDGRGHAYIGVDDPVKNSDTMDPESDDNQVDLYKDKIPDELLA